MQFDFEQIYSSIMHWLCMGEAQTTNVLGGFLHKISNIQNTALDRFF
jgi:hypothetical protein